jgi:hypothetical protein
MAKYVVELKITVRKLCCPEKVSNTLPQFVADAESEQALLDRFKQELESTLVPEDYYSVESERIYGEMQLRNKARR